MIGFDPGVAPYDRYAQYIAALAIAVTAMFNIVGVRWGSTVINLTTIAKFGGLAFIVVLALVRRLAADRRTLHANGSRRERERRPVWTGVGVGVVGV